MRNTARNVSAASARLERALRSSRGAETVVSRCHHVSVSARAALTRRPTVTPARGILAAITGYRFQVGASSTPGRTDPNICCSSALADVPGVR